VQQNPNQQAINQAELMSNIDSALKEAPPSDIMSNKLMNEILYYITPIISLVAFLLVIIFGVIPTFNTLINKLGTIEELKAEDTMLKQRITKMEEIKSRVADLQNVIAKINTIVPEGKTEIVKFAQRIREEVNTNMGRFTFNLDEPAITMDNIKTGELTLATSEKTTNGLKVNQVPTEFTITGGLGRFRQFFSNLYDGDDFFVVEKMALSFDSSSRKWNGSISLVKYQFNKESSFNAASVYGAVSENSIANQKVINFLTLKFLDNKLNGN